MKRCESFGSSFLFGRLEFRKCADFTAKMYPKAKFDHVLKCEIKTMLKVKKVGHIDALGSHTLLHCLFPRKGKERKRIKQEASKLYDY